MCNPSPSFWHDVAAGVTLCQKCYTRGMAPLIRQGDQTSARGRKHQREGDDGMPPTSKQARTLHATANASGVPADTARPPGNTDDHEAALQPPPSKRARTNDPCTLSSGSGGTAAHDNTARPPGARDERDATYYDELSAPTPTETHLLTTDSVPPPPPTLEPRDPGFSLLQGAAPPSER